MHIRNLFRTWDKAGILDDFSVHDLRPHTRYRVVIPFRKCIRTDFVMNKVKVKIMDAKYKKLFASMEEKLNWIYHNARKAGLQEAVVQSNIACPGLPCVVWDRTQDPSGRFLRARIVKIWRNDDDQSSIAICELIDKAEQRSFHLNELYLMVRKFTEVPARIITVQLKYMKQFVGSPKFGMLLHTTLWRYSPYFEMKCEGSLDVTTEVTLWWKDMYVSLNEVVLSKLCEPDDRDVTDPRNRLQGEVCDLVCLTNAYQDGRVFVKPTSRISKAVDDALEDAQENFQVYNGLFKHEDKVYVAPHPIENRVLRCKITDGEPDWELPLDQVSVQVRWIDRGDETILKLSDLVPARSISPVLVLADPLAQEFHLNGIKSIQKISKNEFLSHFPNDRSALIRIVREPYKVRVLAISPPEIDIVVRLATQLKPRNINADLLKLGFAEPSDAVGTFSNKLSLNVSGLTVVPNKYPCLEWATDRRRRFDREDIAPGDQISFFVSKMGSRTFRIRPWYSKSAYESLEAFLRAEHDKLWVQDEMKNMPLGYLPWGKYCLLKKDGKILRAKVSAEHRAAFPESPKHGNRSDEKLYDVMLIDHAEIDKAPISKLWKMFPWHQLLHLGPQAVVAAFEGKFVSPINFQFISYHV